MLREAAKRLLAQRSQTALSRFGQNLPRAYAADTVTDSAGSKSVQTPIPVTGLAGQYASALYSAGVKEDKLSKIAEDISQLSETAKSNARFQAFLEDPTVSRTSKKETLEDVMSKIDVCDLTKNFIRLLIDNNRVGNFMEISNTFAEVIAADRGEVHGTLTTTHGIVPEDRDTIKEALASHFLKPGQRLILEEKTDPKLVAGFTVRIGERYFDNCLASRIKKVEKMIEEANI